MRLMLKTSWTHGSCFRPEAAPPEHRLRQFPGQRASPLTVSVIDDKLKEKMVVEFRHMRNQSYEPLASFMDFITYSYMIDNVILLITGTLHQRAISELVPKCHPLGSFEQMEAVNIAQTPAELYNAILVDTPLGKAPRVKQVVLQQAWRQRNVQFQGKNVYFDQDYSPEVQRKRKQVREVIKRLKERDIKAQSPYPAQLKLFLDNGTKTFPSLWEAQPTLKALGLNVSVDDRDILEREFHERWRIQGKQRRDELALTPKEIRAILNGATQNEEQFE
ncbi:hypothetical protein WMY93_012600 [Mugilogobius chulae]|uniref:Uncharacterized protein n=1 Tax=Mugilogobius chulae TaxID=88201 RepID=A0AAW0P3Q5_9GOBI